MPNILGCLHSALRHVGCPVDGASLNAANGDGDGEKDRKERFHGTKVFVAARSRAFTRMISVFPFRLTPGVLPPVIDGRTLAAFHASVMRALVMHRRFAARFTMKATLTGFEPVLPP